MSNLNHLSNHIIETSKSGMLEEVKGLKFGKYKIPCASMGSKKN